VLQGRKSATHPSQKGLGSMHVASSALQERVWYDTEHECWLVMGYEEGRFVLDQERIFAASPDNPRDESSDDHAKSDETGPLADVFRQVVFLDGTAHTRVREAMDVPLTRKVKAMRSYVQRGVDLFLAPLQQIGRMDVEEDFAAPLTLLGLAHMIGMDVPPAATLATMTADEIVTLRTRLMTLRQWSNHLVDVTTGFFSVEALQGVIAMHAHFHDLLSQKRDTLQDDIGCAYATAPAFHTDAERVINTMALFSAGNVTTTTLIVNAIPLLLGNPGEFKRLQRELTNDPPLISKVVRELLRLATPTQYVARFAKTDVIIGGHAIKQGDKIILHLATMNRDSTVFPDPDHFDIRRPNNHRHAAFGFGAHKCPGAPFALLEATTALGQLLRTPGLHLIQGQPLSVNRNENQLRYQHVYVGSA